MLQLGAVRWVKYSNIYFIFILFYFNKIDNLLNIILVINRLDDNMNGVNNYNNYNNSSNNYNLNNDNRNYWNEIIYMIHEMNVDEMIVPVHNRDYLLGVISAAASKSSSAENIGAVSGSKFPSALI